MKTETIKLVFTYSIVGFVVIYGMVTIANATLHEVPSTANVTGAIAVLGGFVGVGLQFLTGSEIAKRAEVAANTAFATGAGTQPTVTTTAGPPATTTVTPPATEPPPEEAQP